MVKINGFSLFYENTLFTDTEARKDAAEQVVGGDFAGDFTQGVMDLAQVFGDEFTSAPTTHLRQCVGRPFMADIKHMSGTKCPTYDGYTMVG